MVVPIAVAGATGGKPGKGAKLSNHGPKTKLPKKLLAGFQSTPGPKLTQTGQKSAKSAG